MKKVTVFYHNGTVDGKTTAYILKGLLPDAEYIPIDFTSVNKFEKIDVDGHDVYILGFPMSEYLWNNLKGYSKLTYISNHIESIPTDVNCIECENESTFISLWGSIFPGKNLPNIYKHMSRYLKNPYAVRGTEDVLGFYICSILSFCPTLESFGDKLKELSTNVEDQRMSSIYAEGFAHAQTIQSLASHILEASKDTDSIHPMFGVDSLIVNIPKIFNVFIKQHLLEEYSTVVTYNDIGTKRYWAIHSNEIDVVAIAKLFEGFGEKTSAGFTTDQDLTFIELNDIWEKTCLP